MFERFTDRARRVVVLAQEEARLLGHNYIGTEHILLGLIAEGEGVAAKVLEQVGISLDEVRTKVESIIGEAAGSPSGHIPFTPRAKKVLELSLREALALGHNYIGTEHILLGLIREGQGVAAQVLATMGADLSLVRQTVIEQLSGVKGRTLSGMGAPLRETPAMQKSRVEARRLAGSKAIGSHHLLLALLSDEKSLAARALTALGVTREAVEEQVNLHDTAGTSDETPEEAGARRIGMRVEGKLLMLEIDDPELAESVEKAMVGRKLRIIKGSDPEASGFADLWSTVSRTVDDVTRRLTRVPGVRRTSMGSSAKSRRVPPGWDPLTLAATYTMMSTTMGFVGYFEVGKDVDRQGARAWLRDWLEQNRANLLGPPVEEATEYCGFWFLVSRAGQPFGMQKVSMETDGAGCEPVPLDVLIEAALADLAVAA